MKSNAFNLKFLLQESVLTGAQFLARDTILEVGLGCLKVWPSPSFHLAFIKDICEQASVTDISP